MTPIEQSVREDIRDGIHTFYAWVDGGQASRTADLFTRDASLTFGPGSPKPGTIQGAEIRQSMIAREALKTDFTRHAISNIVLRPAEAGVDAQYLLTLYRSDDETRSSMPAFVADVGETWVREDDAWKISSRLITPAFVRS